MRLKVICQCNEMDFIVCSDTFLVFLEKKKKKSPSASHIFFWSHPAYLYAAEGSPQLMLTFGEDWQKVLALRTRPLFQQGLAKKDPIHNCRPIIFAWSCTLLRLIGSWIISARTAAIRSTCDTDERLRQNWPIVSWFWKKALLFRAESAPSLLTSLGDTKVVVLERLCQGPGSTFEARMGFIFNVFCFFLFFCLHVVVFF